MKDRIPSEYEITRDGRVISHHFRRPRELRQHINGSGYGYPSVHLWVMDEKRKWHVAVYRLVAAIWLPPRPSPKHEVRHLDGDRFNSHADNLAWGTHTENCADRVRHALERGYLGKPIDGTVYY